MYDLRVDNAVLDARSNFASGRIYFLAYNGVGTEVPGIEGGSDLLKSVGYVEIRGTSDFPKTLEEENANDRAMQYSRDYNAELMRLIRINSRPR